MRIELYHSGGEPYDLNLRYCGKEDVGRQFSVGFHFRDCYLVHFIDRGKGHFETMHQRHAVGPGEVFCIFPQVLSRYMTDATDPWSFHWFAFSGRLAAELVRRAGLTPARPVLPTGTASELPSLIDQLIDHMRRGNPLPTELTGYLFLLLARLEDAARLGQGSAQRPLNVSESLAKVIEYVNYRYHLPITVMDLARYAGYERTYFSKVFHKEIGVPPQVFLFRFRMEKACELLRATKWSVKQISQCVGIEEENYFSRAFRRHVGTSPTDYRIEHESSSK